MIVTKVIGVVMGHSLTGELGSSGTNRRLVGDCLFLRPCND